MRSLSKISENMHTTTDLSTSTDTDPSPTPTKELSTLTRTEDKEWNSLFVPGGWGTGQCIAHVCSRSLGPTLSLCDHAFLPEPDWVNGEWSFHLCSDGLIRVFVMQKITIRKMTAGSPLWNAERDCFTLPEIISFFEDQVDRPAYFKDDEFQCVESLIKTVSELEYRRLHHDPPSISRPSFTQCLYKHAISLMYARQKGAQLIFPCGERQHRLGRVSAVSLMGDAQHVCLQLVCAEHYAYFAIKADLVYYGIYILRPDQSIMHDGGSVIRL